MSKIKYNTIQKCRICNSNKLESILDLGELYVSNFIDKEKPKKQCIAPLELVLCKGECRLIQLRHTVSAQEMFREYWYLSGINESMNVELKHIVKSVESLIKLNKDDYVVDIGANDGTLLRHYNKKINTIGFEPALNLKKLNTKGVSKIIPEFFNYEKWNKFYPNKTAKVITAIGMFYDLDDPNMFVSSIEKILSDDGLFVIQMMYLPLFIEKNAFDGICHEHLEYYSLYTLEYLLLKQNLKVVGLEIREKVNEGSARFYISKSNFSNQINVKNDFKENLRFYRNKEAKLKLDNADIYNKLILTINQVKEKTMSFLFSERMKGKLIHGYAASTKGNTTLQYYGIKSDLIEAISDRNPEKWGKYTVGSNIPVISEEESRNKNPDYYFVLAWHFIDTFVEREKEFLQNGGKFIISTPYFRVIDKNNYKDLLSSFKNKNQINMLNKVQFYENSYFSDIDFRRIINGVAGDFGKKLEIKQIKIIEFKGLKLENIKPVGNHSHLGTSNQWEMIVVIGSQKKPQIDFRYRNLGYKKTFQKNLFGGDIAFIPPGCSLALMPLDINVKLVEISNQIYNPKNYLIDEIFKV